MKPSRFHCGACILLLVLLQALWIPSLLRAEANPAPNKVQATVPAKPGDEVTTESHTTNHPSNQFVRFKEDSTGAWLQCAMTTYRNAEGVTVTLVGAVHIGDPEYYAKLNEIFKAHDVVLYELVGGPIQKRKATIAAAENSPDPARSNDPSKDSTPANSDTSKSEMEAAKRLSWLNPIHQKLQKTLELQSQLEGIDYYAPNFVHADMTHSQFASKQRERNESFLKLWLRSIQIQMENPQIGQSQPGLLKILEILTRNDSATELKRVFARTFDSVDALIAGLEGEEGTVILSERNKVALEVLKKQIAKGKKTPAIFYGAAHLPDMEKRLLAMGFQKIDTQWLSAWSLPPEPEFESDKKLSTSNDLKPPTQQ